MADSQDGDSDHEKPKVLLIKTYHENKKKTAKIVEAIQTIAKKCGVEPLSVSYKLVKCVNMTKVCYLHVSISVCNDEKAKHFINMYSLYRSVPLEHFKEVDFKHIPIAVSDDLNTHIQFKSEENLIDQISALEHIVETAYGQIEALETKVEAIDAFMKANSVYHFKDIIDSLLVHLGNEGLCDTSYVRKQLFPNLQ